MAACALLALALLIAGPPARGGEGAQEDGWLERKAWWPLEAGPHYGDVPAASLFHPRVIRLRAGSFDTRGEGLALPQELKLDAEAAASPRTPWIVQLRGPIHERQKDALRRAGVRIYRYVPNYAFIVRAPDPAALSSLPGVLWAGPYHPAYRIEPALGQAPTRDPVKARNERIHVRALLFEASEKDTVIGQLKDLGAAVDGRWTRDPHDKPNRVYFTATPVQILAAARLDAVEWIEEVSTEGMTLNAETKVFMQSGFINGGTPYWDAGVDGSTQVVGDMDSGLDVDTILVSDTATDAGTPGPSHRKVLAYTAWGGGDLSSCAGTSGYSHGTNTTQCAVGNRSDLGLSGNLDGVAKGAKVIFQDVGPSDLICCLVGCLDPPAQLFGMYDEVRAQGGHLTNGSFAICSYGTYGSHALDADLYAWDHKDFLAFFSGGNGGSGNACPGTNKNNISSGGHYQDPFENEFYGSTGPSPDGRMGPTVLAPACDHAGGHTEPEFDFDTSTSIQSNDNDLTGPPAGDEGIAQGRCGTSFSSPYLMGAAALIRDYFEKGFFPTGQANTADAFAPSGALVKAALINSGDYMAGCTGCETPGLMGSMGMGRVNLSNTLAVAGDARTPQGTRVVDRGMDVGLATGEVFEDTFEILDPTQEFRVTLVWVDREGSTLTNDLRLKVIGPDGTPAQTYLGNNFSGPYSLSEAAGGASEDLANVFESVRVDPAELVAGRWTVRVEGANVPMGDPNFGNTQPFALIASGGFDSLGVGEISPSGSASPLRVTGASGADVTWEWEDAGDPGIAYSFYRGTLDSLRGGVYDHAMVDAAHCGLNAPSTVISDRTDGADAYYLVAGSRNGHDGPLGDDSAGNPRPAADPACP